MKKIYLSALAVGLMTTSVIGQNLTSQYKFDNKAELSEAKLTKKHGNNTLQTPQTKAVVWSETFGGIGTAPASTAGPTFSTANGVWTTGGADASAWKHSFYTTSGTWSGGTTPFASTSANDGFMLFDADSVNTDYTVTPIAMVAAPADLIGELISPVIDLTAEASALLTFQQNFRWCCAGTHQIEVSVSADNGVTWSPPTSAIPSSVSANDDFESVTGSYSYQINLTGVAAGNMVMLKFAWIGTGGNSHYFWNIDDIEISQLEANNVQNLASYIVGAGNNGVEYGRTPMSNIPTSWTVGSQVRNFSYTTPLTTTMTSDFVSFSTAPPTVDIDMDSVRNIESIESPALSIGTYSGVYTVTAGTDVNGAPTFVDNVQSREFAISQSEYSLDGIGIYTTNVSGTSIGTASFTGAADNVFLGALYHIEPTTIVTSLKVMLASSTVPGSQIQGSIMPASKFQNDTVNVKLGTSAKLTITAADTTQGFVMLPLVTPVTLTTGDFYAVVELFSLGGNFEIAILDDESVAQPSVASMINILDGTPAVPTSYTNGTAVGVRMMVNNLGVNENSLNGVNVYPNPTTGKFTVTNENNTENTVAIFDMLGKEVYTNTTSSSLTVDLSANGMGVYLVKVSNENGSIVKRVVIK